jgi:heparan-alpha-glucosaminide N-acetyltransferase
MNSAADAKSVFRLASIDAYRGLVMVLMMAEVLNLCLVSQALPDSGFWRFLCHQQTHVEWVGCSLHDLIQPAFSFLVGVVLPFSIARRHARGESFGGLARHALIRSMVLVALGLFIASIHTLPALKLDFGDTLAQIGLAYIPVFVLGFCRRRYWWIALISLLIGYWLFFALYPLPPPDFNYANTGVSKEWLAENGLSGFAAHWQINSNPAAAFDLWFLNKFPRPEPYLPHKGLTTLNFVPLIGTMILGLFAGDVLRSDREPWGRVRCLALAGGITLGSGWTLGALGVCPIVKSIWTPSWVLFSGGWCFLFMAVAYILVDIYGQRKLAMPLIIVGMNSIVAYCLSHFFESLAFNSFHRVFGWKIFRIFGDAFEPLDYGFFVLMFFWLVLYLMYRLKIFVRI